MGAGNGVEKWSVQPLTIQSLLTLESQLVTVLFLQTGRQGCRIGVAFRELDRGRMQSSWSPVTSHLCSAVYCCPPYPHACLAGVLKEIPASEYIGF